MPTKFDVDSYKFQTMFWNCSDANRCTVLSKHSIICIIKLHFIVNKVISLSRAIWLSESFSLQVRAFNSSKIEHHHTAAERSLPEPSASSSTSSAAILSTMRDSRSKELFLPAGRPEIYHLKKSIKISKKNPPIYLSLHLPVASND